MPNLPLQPGAASPGSTWRRGFTLVELLVVVAVIALLLSILLPTLSRARALARQAQCKLNNKHWGIAQMMFPNEHGGAVAWDGEDNPGEIPDGGTGATYTYDFWWANDVVTYVDGTPYRQLAENALRDGDAKDVPMPGRHEGMFVCPDAEAPVASDRNGEAPYPIAGTDMYFYFNYVPNSKLNADSPIRWGSLDVEQIRLEQIPRAAATVLMLEIRSHNRELPDRLQDDSAYTNHDYNRAKARWANMAARHDEGGFAVFADGHVGHVDVEYANTRESEDFVYPHQWGYNKSDLIWNPLGRAR